MKTLKQFIEELQALAKKNPKALNMPVVYAKDAEGNGFYEVGFKPTTGIYEDGDFIPSLQLKKNDRKKSEINSVCIN